MSAKPVAITDSEDDPDDDGVTLAVDYEVSSTETGHQGCCVHCPLLDVNYKVTPQDTVQQDCCIHCPLLKEYLKHHRVWRGYPVWPSEAPTNKQT
jgi:hypothetical protein